MLRLEMRAAMNGDLGHAELLNADETRTLVDETEEWLYGGGLEGRGTGESWSNEPQVMNRTQLTLRGDADEVIQRTVEVEARLRELNKVRE